MFESANSLDAGETQWTLAGAVNPGLNSNAGGSFLGIVDIGLSSNTDLRMRLERRLEPSALISLPFLGNIDAALPYTFVEAGAKWSLGRRWAISLPAQLYFLDQEAGSPMFFLNPRWIWSQRPAGKAREFTTVLSTMVGIPDDGIEVIPGIAAGIAMGDRECMKTRIEMGFNAMSQLTFGFGIQFNTKGLRSESD